MPGFDVQFKFRPNPAAIAKLNGALFRALDETLDIDIQTEAKDRSPYITGMNRRSIGIEVEEVGGRVEGSIFTQSGYGGYLEIGTSKMAAQPYLWPAVESHAPKIFERMRRFL
ncbi:hypothetical protein LCGC14_1395070 [marine sediment metagenome]|uniref:HK97 gp10 family phage protein n=1 Tax=marine sediment metagenome TaxID=412755 RepID=A0A0F9JYZ9_9ZZZZ